MLRIFRGFHRFVEANRRFDLLLQFGVIENVVVGQRLLNHHKIKVVERFEKRRVEERIGRVSIAHQTNLGKLPAHLLDNPQVPARLDLDLDSLVAIR